MCGGMKEVPEFMKQEKNASFRAAGDMAAE